MNYTKSSKAMKALEAVKNRVDVPGYKTVRNHVIKASDGYHFTVDVAYEGTRTIKYRTLQEAING